jgi:pyruvate dehydrogenase E2 component (dihydrolipoamide acetyltransferase)
MARWEYKLPEIGEAVSEGELVGWLVEVGQSVSEDQAICELMTDKATVTVTVPRRGVVVERRGKVGDLVKVHEPIVVLELEGAAAPAESPKPNGAHGPAEPAAPVAVPAPARPAAPVVAPAPSGYFNEKPLATPATRKVARDLGVDLRSVSPSGDSGRVTRSDVEAFAARGGAALAAPVAADAAPVVEAAVVARAAGVRRADRRVPFVGVRRKIAQKMQQSKNTAAHFTFVEECDATALIALRAKLRPLAEKQGVKLTFLPFVVKAVVGALKRAPILNSTLDEATNELVYKANVDIGIAASTDNGLMVPVLRNADQLSILDIAREIDRLANAAKSGKAKPDELSGSTFTITSLGQLGGLFATPVINFPEVGILGLHQIKEKPVVKDGQIVIGQVMLLSLSFDHRIVDGHVGAAFAYDVIRTLENPESLLLELA